MGNKFLEVSCPECKKKFNYYSTTTRPFCCEVCQLVDLGLWLNESYTVPSMQGLSESDMELILKSQEQESED